MILFIDDELRVMDSYREYLTLRLRSQGYKVLFLNDIDKALDFLEKRPEELDLIILDIMMPWGKTLSAERTNHGLLTGVVFYDQVRESLPNLPILVFTNYSDAALEQRLRKDPHCRFLQKEDYLLEDFASEVSNLLTASSKN